MIVLDSTTLARALVNNILAAPTTAQADAHAIAVFDRIARLEAALQTIAFQGYEIPKQIANNALKEE